jgi:hypothetical protein
MISAIQRPTTVASAIHSLATVTTIATRVNITIIPASSARICRLCPENRQTGGNNRERTWTEQAYHPAQKSDYQNIETSRYKSCDCSEAISSCGCVQDMCKSAGFVWLCIFPEGRYKAIQLTSWERNGDIQPALGAVHQLQLAVQLCGQLRSNCQTQSGSAGIAVARCFNPIKRLQYGLQLGIGYSRPSIMWITTSLADESSMTIGALAKFQGVIQQVGHHPAKRLRTRDNRQTGFACLKLHVFTDVLIIAGDAVDPGISSSFSDVSSSDSDDRA